MDLDQVTDDGAVVDVSVIIPAYNEANFIAATVASVTRFIPRDFRREIIVVDHGSADDTVELARSAGADVIEFPDAPTIAALRNRGIARSSGRILVFLDADTTLTEDWSRTVPQVIRNLDADPLQLTGAKRSVPDSTSPMARFWFAPKASDPRPTHLGGGHIITTRTLCDTINGFPEGMETGEDFRFCLNAKRAGAVINAVPSLRAVHNGLPSTLSQFFKRETWHGRGDWTSLQTAFSTKVAVLTLIFIALHLALLGSLFLLPELSSVTAVLIMAIVGMCVLASLIKYRKSNWAHVLCNTFMYYVYFAARAVAFFTVMAGSRVRKHQRS